ncbi:MAG TPA: hypothetical protein V6C52_05455 [Coleofasciculaceae cyanobacterium]
MQVTARPMPLNLYFASKSEKPNFHSEQPTSSAQKSPGRRNLIFKLSDAAANAYQQSYILGEQAEQSGRWQDRAKCYKNLAKLLLCGGLVVISQLPKVFYRKLVSERRNPPQ